jgi:hypothetical protein
LVLSVASGIAAVLLVSLCVALTSEDKGAQSLWVDLLQYRTRDDAVAYGSHWHYHFVSTLWFAFGGSVALSWLGAFANLDVFRPRPRGGLWYVACAYVAIVTLAFGMSRATFTSVLYTGHQARELATHVPITMLLGFAALAVVAPPQPLRSQQTSWQRIASAMRLSPLSTLWSVAIPIALAAVMCTGDVMREGQSQGGLSAMIAAHQFEHVLDYAFTVLVALAVGLLPTSSS